MVDKLVRDGKVAVIYSPGYGAGWSTWADNENAVKMVFCPRLAKAIVDKTEDPLLVAEEEFPTEYTGGIEEAVVEWLEQGTLFEIQEYDGSESLRIIDPKFCEFLSA